MILTTVDKDEKNYAETLEALAEAIKRAQAEGFLVRVATPSELFVDLDSPESFTWFTEKFAALEIAGIVSSYQLTTSKSGNKHAYVKLSREMSIFPRIALQAVLGSDLLHEFLTLRTALSHGTKAEDTPIVFFETTLVDTF